MVNKKQPLVQTIILSIIMIVIITLVILVYIFRFSLFGPKDLSVYGSRSITEISACTVEGKTDLGTRCTDTGKQISIAKCVQNRETGYMCWDGEKQVTSSKVTVSSCIPTCRSFLWNETGSTPCLTERSYNPTGLGIITYGSKSLEWCSNSNIGSKIKTYSCDRIDGSGTNFCTFKCDGNSVYNPDCYTYFPSGYSYIGGTLLYKPDIVPNNSNIDISTNGTIYTYEPTSRAGAGYPIIAASTMTTKESCTDPTITICGNYTKKDNSNNSLPNYSNKIIMKSDCNLNKYMEAASGIGYNFGPSDYDYSPATANTVYDIIEPGTYKETLTCFDRSGSTVNAKCNPRPSGCIDLSDIFVTPPDQDNNILKLIPINSEESASVCGTSVITSGILTGVTEDPSILNPCIASNPNFSLNPNANLLPTFVRPYIQANTFLFSSTENIFAVPLNMRNNNSYLSLYNNPCPHYTISYQYGAKVFNFANDGSFVNPPIDSIPPTGIPFMFDCKGSPSGVLQDTPCTWIEDVKTNASSIYGLDPSCNNRNNDISPIMEQTSLILMIRPANLNLLEINLFNYIKCNIFVISNSDIVGWLSYSTDVSGYNTTGTPTAVLTFKQGRLDPYGNAINLPGTRVENMTNGALYLQRFGTGTDYSYKLYTTNYTEIQYIKNSDGSITNLDSFYFSRATTSGNSVVNNGVIDDTNYSNLLYSRSNRAIDGCNALLSR